MSASIRTILTPGVCCRLALSWLIVIAFQSGASHWLDAPISTPVAIGNFVVLFCVILIAAFAVVTQADHQAHALGEPYGTLILTLSIVLIEVVLISAVMLGPGQSDTIARDSIFAVMMLIMNLIMGLCLLLGGVKYGEQEYNSQGAVAYLSMMLVLIGIALVLPNYVSGGNGTYAFSQSVFVILTTLGMYAVFLYWQMKRYRRFFIQPDFGFLAVPVESHTMEKPAQSLKAGQKVATRDVVLRSVLLVLFVIPIVLLAHDLAILIDLGVEYANAPVAVGGILIAIIVFTPESIAALKAALDNQMQRSINLCLGAFVSTVGLTVPAVLTVGLLTGQTVLLGLNSLDTILLVMTMSLSIMTFLGLRSSPVQGMAHLALFAIYMMLLFNP